MIPPSALGREPAIMMSKPARGVKTSRPTFRLDPTPGGGDLTGVRFWMEVRSERFRGGAAAPGRDAHSSPASPSSAPGGRTPCSSSAPRSGRSGSCRRVAALLRRAS